MLSLLLLVALVADLGLWAGVAHHLMVQGVSATTAAAVATGGFFGWKALLVAMLYVVARLHGGARRIRAGAVLFEYLAFLALFVVLQPFERLWMGRNRDPAPGKPLVLLVHGYLCNRGAWWWLRRGLARRGFAVTAINLEPPFGSIDTFASEIRARLDAMLAASGADRAVLIAHSQGGVACLAALRKFGPEGVARLVTIAAPFHGTWVARLGLGWNARELRPDSDWMRALDADAGSPVPTTSIWSDGDNIIAPCESSCLAGARNLMLDGVGHLSLGFSCRVLEMLADEAAAATGECREAAARRRSDQESGLR